MSGSVVGTALASAAASAVVGSVLSGSGSGSSGSGAAQADPFAAQRPQYQSMLQQLMTNPSSITSTPGYQYTLGQGEAAVNQGAAASGMLNSGNRMIALQNLGQQSAETDYNNQFVRLAQLSGANVGSPGEAGALTAANTAQNNAVAGQIGNAVSTGINNYSGNTGTGISNYLQDPSLSTDSSGSISGFGDYSGVNSSGTDTSLFGAFNSSSL